MSSLSDKAVIRLHEQVKELEAQLAHKEELRQEALRCLKYTATRAKKLEGMQRLRKQHAAVLLDELETRLNIANMEIERLQAALDKK